MHDAKGSSHRLAPLLCHRRTVRVSVGRRCLLRKLFLDDCHTPPTLPSFLLHSFALCFTSSLILHPSLHSPWAFTVSLTIGILALRPLVSLFLCYILSPSVSLPGTRLDTTTTCDEPGYLIVSSPGILMWSIACQVLQLYYPPLPYSGEQDGIEIRFIQSEKWDQFAN